MSQDADTAAQAQTASAQIVADAQRSSAEFSASAQIAAAGAQAGATASAAIASGQAQIVVAQINAANHIAVQNLVSANNTSTLQTQGEQQRAVAQLNIDGQIQIATQDAATRAALQASQNASNLAITNAEIANRVQIAQINTNAALNQTSTETAARLSIADTDAATQRYSADKQYAAVQLREQGEASRLATKLNYADAKFQLAYSLAQQGLEFAQDGELSTPGLLDPATAPYISVRGVFTPAQVQQQVNAAYSRNDARTQSQIRQAQGDLSGRGFSSNSPLLDALRVGFSGNNLKANNDAATSIRLQSASANADQVTKGQTLAVSQWQTKQQVAIDSEKNQITRQVGLLGAVAQMVSGVA